MSFEELLRLSADVKEVQIDQRVFYVTSMSGANRDYLEAQARKDITKEIRQYVVACCLCDETGKRFDPMATRKRELGQMPAPHLEKMFAAAMEVSGLQTEGEEEPEGN